MEYSVEQLASAAGVAVDTIRFYQAKGLLPAPRRVGRRAVYGARHLAVLGRIRRYQADGLPLAVVKRLLTAGGPRSKKAALLAAVSAETRRAVADPRRAGGALGRSRAAARLAGGGRAPGAGERRRRGALRRGRPAHGARRRWRCSAPASRCRS